MALINRSYDYERLLIARHERDDALAEVERKEIEIAELRQSLAQASDDALRLREALDSLAEAATVFSTLADYTVDKATEEEFVAALDDATRLLRAADA